VVRGRYLQLQLRLGGRTLNVEPGVLREVAVLFLVVVIVLLFVTHQVWMRWIFG
jgi:hypothetical protein